MKCSILISFLTLYLEIILCDEFNIVRLNKKILKFSNDVQSSYLICLTDSINDAIVWNTDIIWNKIVNYTLRDREFSQKKPELIHPKSSHNCKFSFHLEQSDWKLTWNTEVPMGPVFDSHWENCSEKNGGFGHNCREKCDNCQDQKCNIYTGECRGGCKKLDGEYRYVPPFCKYTVKFPKLLFEMIDLWNLRIYFPKVNYNKKLNITYEFELQENDSRHRKQNAETGDDTKIGPIYFTIFNKLIPGVEYKARILQHIQYKELDWIEEVRIDGDFSKQLTMCSWSENFTIELDDETLTINRIDLEDLFSCPDEYYSVEVLSTMSKTKESGTIDVTNVKGKFPMIVRNLTPNTNYLISITGLSPSYHYRREVQTFPIKSLPIRESRIDSVTSTEISFSWLPSEGTNDTIEGYSVSIKALRYESCDNHMSMDSIKTQLHEIANTSRSYTIRDLIPYVHYELIILAHHADKDTKSIITFTTPAKVIPTAVFHNLTFDNGIIRWNKTVANCSTVTGPIHATRLFFFGVSENVKQFTDQYDTMMDTFTLHETKQQDIHSCEQYRVRIHPLREINGTHNESAYNELIFTADPRLPRHPGKIFTTKIEQGVVDLNWEYPPKAIGLMKDFIIHYQLMLSKLKRELRVIDFNNFIFYPITSYQDVYTTQLKLLPSTYYKIDIIGVVECGEYTLVGNSSSIEILTPSSFAWYKDEPSYIVNNNNFSITVHLPDINYETVNIKIQIFLIGEASCGESVKLNESLARDIELKDGEKVYYIDLFTTPPLKILIGGHRNNNNTTNCELFSGSSYIIVIVIRDDIDDSKPFVWRSRSIKFVPRNRYEIWAVPLLILIIIIGLIIIVWYFKRTKKRRVKIKNNRGRNEAWRCSQRDLNLEPINEGRYIERTLETLVKLDTFRDYVKCAIASGKLETQYSRLSSSRVKSSDDGLLSQQGSGDTDYITVANETAVILKRHPGDPYFECLNAHYISGYKKHRAYIVLEGPESTAVINFWRLVWQEQIEIICMLSDIVDDEQMKCEQYWPELGKSMEFGNITVDNINHTPFADYTFRVFEMKCDEEKRTMNHLHYTAWPDYGIPLYTQSVVTYLKKLFAIPSSAGPVLVHCKAGVGRTGIIVLLDICHRRAIAEGVLDIFGATEEIKRQRKNMVDNKQQYIFAHVALVECLLSQSTAIICNELLSMKIQERKYQLTLEQERLEQSVLQDKALQFSTRSKLKLSEKNIAKNRFPATLPPTRLYIPRYPLSDDDSSYISGVYVDSARRRNSYIASQIPLPTTVTDFWRMIAEFKVELIIILQRPDLQDPTCCNFIPEPDEEMEALPFFNIIGKSVTDGEHFSQQKIVLVDESQGTPREQSIMVLTCEGWKSGRDKRPPMPITLVKLWQMAERISRSDEPTVVLCHDGVTGCGLYLALSLLLERMGLELECDVCFAIRAIRRSRFNFCTSKVIISQDQFKYLYNAASLYAAHFDAYSNFK